MHSGASELTVNVAMVAGDCAWAASTSSPFLSIKEGATGHGAGPVVLAIAANSGEARVGSATVAGRTVTLTQEAAAPVPGPTPTPSPCLFTISPTVLTPPSTGGTFPITITKTQGSNCAWTSQPQASFLTITANGSGTDSGTTQVTAAPNFGGARTGTVLIAGQTLTVNQAAGGSGPLVAFLSFTSDQGDFVGGGQSRTYSLSASQFTVTLDAGQSLLTFSIPPTGSEWWDLSLKAASGALAPGLYERAYRHPFQAPGQHGISFTGSGRGCNQSTGRFLVSEAVFSGGAVQRFHAKFQQYCEGWSSALQGELWIDAQGATTPPPMGSLPVGAPPTSFFSYTSDPGDPVGQGGSQTFTLSNMKFRAWHDPSRPYVNIWVETPGTTNFSRWILDFIAPSGTVLAPGTYENAVRYPFQPPGVPGLSIKGGCNTVTGRFVVHEATYGPRGEVYRFRATFEQHCDGIVPALRGEVFIASDPWR